MKNNISEDEVFKSYENGLPEDFKIDKSKIRKKPVNLKNSTVQISMKVEYDLLQEIKNKSEEKGLPYQTFIKQILRNYLKESNFEEKIRNIEKRLVFLEKKQA